MAVISKAICKIIFVLKAEVLRYKLKSVNENKHISHYLDTYHCMEYISWLDLNRIIHSEILTVIISKVSWKWRKHISPLHLCIIGLIYTQFYYLSLQSIWVPGLPPDPSHHRIFTWVIASSLLVSLLFWIPPRSQKCLLKLSHGLLLFFQKCFNRSVYSSHLE